MKKVLFISNHAGFSKFNAPYMQWFHDQGWRVDNVSPGIETGYYDNQYDLPIKRNPFAISNIKALFLLKKICKENQYDIIHCHTPVGGVLGRLCINKKKCNTKVIYTAHGFHFFKGARIINWLIFYPIEKILANRTDCIVTINDEDYECAKKHFNTDVRKINGVGINLERFNPISEKEKNEIREKNGFSREDFIIIYCAQFIPRKNHKFLIDKLFELQDKIPNAKLCFVGSGKDEIKIKKYVEQMHLADKVVFLGYRTDVEKLYGMSDIVTSSSVQEGFGIAVIEGAACGLPAIISRIRGHTNININILYDFNNDSFNKGLLSLYTDKKMRDCLGIYNVDYVKQFSIESSLMKMAEIYKEYM